MARFPVRCRTCGARQTLPRHPDAYLRPRACWSCGRRAGAEGKRAWNPWYVDRWMMRRDTKAMGCACQGYNFGGAYHRRGSLRCWYRADGLIRIPGDADFYDKHYEEVA